MEEEVGIKVTRLRRRLSVEAEDVKSPSTQSTPTKKRGGRLAAKPQLELIDENATEVEKPKRTRKPAAKDVEPEEKAATPSRRSTRIKSNTSIVSETPAEEEKGTPAKRSTRTRSNTSIVSETPAEEEKGTPARRSTRMKSNTSIVADTVQYTDSPRAKRAARRTSQVGSDNEAPITPARQTRRTRKDSTSSIDKQVEPNAGKLGTQVKEVIVEENETNKEAKSHETPSKDKIDSPAVRKSPRLVDKTGRKSVDNNENEDEKSDDLNSSSTKDKSIIIEENNLSVSSSNLINSLDDKPTKGTSNLNKTTSEVEEPQVKSKRHRTKSWTTISSSPSKDNLFLSDTEVVKKNNKNEINLSNISSSGDNLLNTSNKSVKEHKEQDMKECSLNSSVASEKNKKETNEELIHSIKDVSVINTSAKLDKSVADVQESPIISKTDFSSSEKYDPSFTEKFFEKAPSGVVQSLVYIEDSDSNTGSVEKDNGNKEVDSEDQCVPVIKHQLEDEVSKVNNNVSYEPMDVDETMPENVSLSGFTEKNISVRQDEDNSKSGKRISLNVSQVSNVSIDDKSSKSSRKSRILDDDKESTLNKSDRKSLLNTTSNDSLRDDRINKSNRKSLVSNVGVNNAVDANSNPSKRQSIAEESINKSKRKSFNLSSLNDEESDKISANSDNNASLNKSKRKSTDNHDEIDDQANKSNRKSSISNINIEDDVAKKSNRKSLNDASKSDVELNSSHTSKNDDIMNRSSKSKRNSLNITNDYYISNDVTDSINIENSKKSKRKSSISPDNINDINNKPKAANINNEDAMDISSNKSERKSSIIDVADTDSVNKTLDKSKRKSSITNMVDNDVVDSPNKSNPKSSVEDTNNEGKNKVTNKTKIKESTNFDNDESMDKNSDKSKRKSSISNVDDDMNKSSNKSKRKSSLSHMESQSFDRSGNENKSTLVLSQIKDTSEANVPKDVYEFNDSNDSNEQLSKSVNVPNVNKDKEVDKKNLSLTYSTSTPLQQKSLKKLGMQINTSIIAPNSTTKSEKKGEINRSKKQTSVLSQNDEETEPSDEENEENSEEDSEAEEEEDSEDESVHKSKLIDNEAGEASEDYESGDSRDEDEKDYEEQNEIVEKGETLDSDEEEFSDDSDYEKDSFIVDSDEEDNELLSGSGDDLSMSDNELNMSAKSKKKFNDHKTKEQKKASREMFEARHKLNESDKNEKSDKQVKSKKAKRQRLESSDSESEEEMVVQTKKNRRARIDSSQDISVTQSDADKSISKKKKQVKRLSESISEDYVANEKEITVHEKNETDKADPLSLKDAVKEEPMTPQKGLNISTVPITNIEEIEEIEVDENVSMVKSNYTLDPLLATIIQDDAMEGDDNDSAESISENEEITQDYETVLNDLNKKSKKIKSLDTSLNLDKKTKQKANEPIVDQLNLTQVKNKQKKKKPESSESTKLEKNKSLVQENIEKISNSLDNQDEGSSDSIDMKLLFNEDSTDGEMKATEKVNDEKAIEEFIPLKRTEGKTNILDSTDVTSSAKDESILNVSKSKKNKRKSSQSEQIAPMNNTSINTLLETSCLNEKNQNKSKLELDSTQTDSTKVNTSVTTPNQSAKKKKNKKLLEYSQVNVETTDDQENENLGFFIDTTGTHADEALSTTNTSVKDSAKKNKRKNNVSIAEIEVAKDDDSNDAPLEVANVSEKNKNISKQALDSTLPDKPHVASATTPTQSTKKKKKNKGLNSSQINVETTDDVAEKSMNASVASISNSNKKKKKNKLSESRVEEETDNIGEEPINASVISVTSSSKKKKKNKLSESHIEVETAKDTLIAAALNISLGSAKKLKQKADSENSSAEDDTVNEGGDKDGVIEKMTSKKRKRKPSANQSIEQILVKDTVKVLDTSKTLNESLVVTNQKKKRKISHNDDDSNALTQDLVSESHKQIQGQEKIFTKKAKNKKQAKAPQEQIPATNEPEPIKKNSKRKAREDDEGDNLSKVIKQNSFDKVHVPRLPDYVLKQLDDKTKNEGTKPSTVSTTSFKVEQTKKRRNKPSNYLEQSVYLNDSVEEAMKKTSLKKPKVLPFVPTASTSGYGFTTNFKVNIVPQETQFVAQSSDTANFKKDYLQKNRIKKLGTFEKYKRQRNIKISKF